MGLGRCKASRPTAQAPDPKRAAPLHQAGIHRHVHDLRRSRANTDRCQRDGLARTHSPIEVWHCRFLWHPRRCVCLGCPSAITSTQHLDHPTLATMQTRLKIRRSLHIATLAASLLLLQGCGLPSAALQADRTFVSELELTIDGKTYVDTLVERCTSSVDGFSAATGRFYAGWQYKDVGPLARPIDIDGILYLQPQRRGSCRQDQSEPSIDVFIVDPRDPAGTKHRIQDKLPHTINGHVVQITKMLWRRIPDSTTDQKRPELKRIDFPPLDKRKLYQ